MNRITHTCKNITLAPIAAGKNSEALHNISKLPPISLMIFETVVEGGGVVARLAISVSWVVGN